MAMNYYEREDGCTVLLFGKHEGEAIEEIPDGYLKWLEGETDDDTLREAVQKELGWRENTGSHIRD